MNLQRDRAVFAGMTGRSESVCLAGHGQCLTTLVRRYSLSDHLDQWFLVVTNKRSGFDVLPATLTLAR